MGRAVLQTADEAGALVFVLHVDGRLVGCEEGGRSVQVLIQVMLPLI